MKNIMSTSQFTHNFDKKPKNISNYFQILTKISKSMAPLNWPKPIRARWYNAKINLDNLHEYLKSCGQKITPYIPA